MKYKKALSVLLMAALTAPCGAYAQEAEENTAASYAQESVPNDSELDISRTKTPIEGMEGYYVMGESAPMAADCYIADESGNAVTGYYSGIDTKTDLGGVLHVSVRAGMTDSRSGCLNKDFKLIVPCYYGSVTVKEENGLIYIEAPQLFSDAIDYYDLEGNKIENLYELTKDGKTSDKTPSGCDKWAENDIKAAIGNSIVPEALQSNYTAKITREEFCELAMETYFQKKGGGLIWTGEYEAPLSPFTDTDNISVSRAYMLGVVNGTGGGKFSPNSFITRQEAAVMLCNMAKVLDIDHTVEAVDKFVDESYFADWAKSSIYRICGIKASSGTPIMAGTGSGKFSPWFNYQRQQAIVTMERIFETVSGTSQDFRNSYKADINEIADSYAIGSLDNSLFTKKSYEAYMQKWKAMADEGTQGSYVTELDDAYRTTAIYLAVCEVMYGSDDFDKAETEEIADEIISNFRSITDMDERELLDFLHGSGELSPFKDHMEDYYSITGSGSVDKYNF